LGQDGSSRATSGACLRPHLVLGLHLGADHRGGGAATDGPVAAVLPVGTSGIGIALALGQSFRLSRAQWRAVLIFGICQNALYLGLNFVAMQTVEASLAAIIASVMPLMVAAANWGLIFRTGCR
jgi:drug/metabolite transporter (DMT)-like permease